VLPPTTRNRLSWATFQSGLLWTFSLKISPTLSLKEESEVTLESMMLCSNTFWKLTN
jgi:hypothetical protein